MTWNMSHGNFGWRKLFFKFMQDYSITRLATGNHRHPFSDFFFLRKGAAVHGLFQAHEFFLITPILFILSKVNAPKQHFRWSQLRNRKNKKNYPNFSISKVQRNHRGTQRQFSENICSEDDLRSRIFGTLVVKFLACLLLLVRSPRIFSNLFSG